MVRLLLVATLGGLAAKFASGMEVEHIDHVDVAGLKAALDTGGADALANMLSTMRATEGRSEGDKEKQFHISRDKGGRSMYDFSDPITTKAPPAPKPKPVPAAVAAKPVASLLLKTPTLLPAGGAGRPDSWPAGWPAQAPGAPAQAPGVPMPLQHLMAATQSPTPTFYMTAQPMMQPMMQGQPANQMEGLVRGLESIRERIDSLAEEAVASVQGRTMQLPQSSMPVVLAGQAQPPSGVSDKVEKELEALAKRVDSLEKDNKELHEQINKDDSQIKADEAAAVKEHVQLLAMAKENAVIKTNMTRLTRRRLRVRKGAMPAAAKHPTLAAENA